MTSPSSKQFQSTWTAHIHVLECCAVFMNFGQTSWNSSKWKIIRSWLLSYSVLPSLLLGICRGCKDQYANIGQPAALCFDIEWILKKRTNLSGNATNFVPCCKKWANHSIQWTSWQKGIRKTISGIVFRDCKYAWLNRYECETYRISIFSVIIQVVKDVWKEKTYLYMKLSK